jgi:hypothetical protein
MSWFPLYDRNPQSFVPKHLLGQAGRLPEGGAADLPLAWPGELPAPYYEVRVDTTGMRVEETGYFTGLAWGRRLAAPRCALVGREHAATGTVA